MFGADEAAEQAQHLMPFIFGPPVAVDTAKVGDLEVGRFLKTILEVAGAEVLQKGAMDESVLTVAHVGKHEVAFLEHPNKLVGSPPRTVDAKLLQLLLDDGLELVFGNKVAREACFLVFRGGGDALQYSHLLPWA